MAGNNGSHFKVELFDGTGNFTLWESRVKDILVQQGLAKPLKGKQDGKPEKMTDDDGNIIEHMNVFNGLVDQLAKVDVNIEEEDKTLILLTSLPSSYDNLVTTILYGKATVKMEEVVPALLSQDKRRRSGGNHELEYAMVGQGQNRKGKFVERGYGKNSRSILNVNVKGIQCFKCKEWGHYKKDCPLWKKVEDKSGGSSAVAIAVDGTSDMGDVLTVSKDIHISTQDKWILDSGCSMHVCFRKGYFDKIQMKKAGMLTLGDGSTCNVEGIGTVKIKMFNGAFYTLGGVAYVPKMCKNLISLSQLDSQGYGYSAQGGVLKITRGYKVLMKGEKYDGLYRLVGSTKYTRISKVWKVCTRETDHQHLVKCLAGVDDGEKENPTMGEVIRDPSPTSTM